MTDGSGPDDLIGIPVLDQEVPSPHDVSWLIPDRRLRRHDTLSETADRLLAGQDPDLDVLPWLSGVLAADFDVQVCLSYVAGPEGVMSLVFHRGLSEALLREGTSLEQSLTGINVVSGNCKAAYIPHIQTKAGEGEAFIRRAGLRAYVAEPLLVGDELLGTLSFGSRTQDRFEADDLAFFRTLAQHVALARRQRNAVRQLAERELRAQARLAEVETANAELHHRVKNLLTTVQAIAYSTVRSSGSLSEFEDAFGGRLAALAKTHDLLVTGARGATSLVRLLRSELEPYDDGIGNRVQLEGPDVALGSESAVPLGMVVHELTTNAAKYGALSVNTGSVQVAWTVDPSDDGQRLRLRWVEEGGPAVSQPSRRGFGSQLLERVLGGQFGAKVERKFAPQGLQVSIDLLL